MPTNEAIKIICDYLWERRIPFTGLTATRSYFTGLTEKMAVYVTVHGWTVGRDAVGVTTHAANSGNSAVDLVVLFNYEE